VFFQITTTNHVSKKTFFDKLAFRKTHRNYL